MKKYIYTSIFIYILALGNIFAHQDFWKIEDYGNIKVRIKTGFNYEEINKVFIFGQLAQKLAEKLDYNNQIFLDFNHHYTGNCDPDYFISFDKGEINYTSDEAFKRKQILRKNSIVIRQVARHFDAITTLKLVEYSIQNLSYIKSLKKEIEYNDNFCNWKIKTIDSNKINNILQRPNSDILNEILSLKIEHPANKINIGISYYWKDSKYTIFNRRENKLDTNLISIENIYYLKKFNNSSAIIFDSDSSFYYANQYNIKQISKRHIIHDTKNYYKPFNVTSIGGDNLSIYFWYFSKEAKYFTKERTLIYLAEKDILVQDLENLIENCK